MSYLVDTPSRILPFGPKQKKHEISGETAQLLRSYLEKNELTDVYVCVNDYDPSGEWRRLRENGRISPVWRYSVGVFSFVGYTLLPNPVFGGNRYNPYTNSLYLNSDVPISVIHEAAVAKDIHTRKLPGTYATFMSLPGLSLLRETRVVGDVVGYSQAEHDWKLERDAYRVLYPQMGASSITAAMPFVTVWWEAPVLGLGGSAIGHLTGRVTEARRLRELTAADPLLQTPPLPTEPSIVDPLDSQTRPVSFLLEEPAPPHKIP